MNHLKATWKNPARCLLVVFFSLLLGPASIAKEWNPEHLSLLNGFAQEHLTVTDETIFIRIGQQKESASAQLSQILEETDHPSPKIVLFAVDLPNREVGVKESFVMASLSDSGKKEQIRQRFSKALSTGTGDAIAGAFYELMLALESPLIQNPTFKSRLLQIGDPDANAAEPASFVSFFMISFGAAGCLLLIFMVNGFSNKEFHINAEGSYRVNSVVQPLRETKLRFDQKIRKQTVVGLSLGGTFGNW